MTTLRFTPSGTGSAGATGRYSSAVDWSPQQTPGPGDTAIITTRTLYIANQTLTAVNLFAFSLSDFSYTGPVLQTQSVTIGAGSNLIVEGRSLFDGTALAVALSFENDGRIELSDFAGFGHLSNYNYSIVNKGTIVLHDTSISPNNIIENDGIISIGSHFSPDFSSITVRGTGTISVEPNTTLTFGVLSAQQTILLTGGTAAHSTIKIVSSFQAPITGFVAGDTIRSPNFYGTPTAVTYAATGPHAGRLTVASSSTALSINLNGDYIASDFVATGSTLYGGVAITTTRTDQGIDAKLPVYRFFDTADGTHFFTSSTTERDTLVNTRPDLAFEGVGLNAADPNGNGAVPVYRFFDTNNGTHFYTDSAAERDTVRAARPDFTFEGTGFYAHTTLQPGDTAIYRFFDTHFGTHFYTASAPEAATITQTRPDLTPEGIGFYTPTLSN